MAWRDSRGLALNELANCELEPLRQDAEFAVSRVAKPDGLPSCLSGSPVLEQPAPIVENHFGHLWVTVHEGPGASFHFTFPSHRAQGGMDVW